MSIFSRIKNIIRSNMNFNNEIHINQEFEENVLNRHVQSEQSVGSQNDFQPKQTQTPEEEYYAILELEYGANFDKIKAAYRKLLKKYHPDLYQNNPEKLKAAMELTKQINDAYTYFEKKFR